MIGELERKMKKMEKKYEKTINKLNTELMRYKKNNEDSDP